MSDDRSGKMDETALFWGFIIGLIVGLLGALFKVPRSGDATRQQIEQNLRDKLEAVLPGDPIAESIAEGKAAARRRQTELGLNH